METEEYRDAKDKAVPRMKRLGPMFSIFPEDLTEANAQATAKRLQGWVIDNVRHV